MNAERIGRVKGTKRSRKKAEIGNGKADVKEIDEKKWRKKVQDEKDKRVVEG